MDYNTVCFHQDQEEDEQVRSSFQS
jgi:hypothetical protein